VLVSALRAWSLHHQIGPQSGCSLSRPLFVQGGAVKHLVVYLVPMPACAFPVEWLWSAWTVLPPRTGDWLLQQIPACKKVFDQVITMLFTSIHIEFILSLNWCLRDVETIETAAVFSVIHYCEPIRFSGALTKEFLKLLERHKQTCHVWFLFSSLNRMIRFALSRIACFGILM